MTDSTPLDTHNFNRQFLAFRTLYYCNETKALIARHKLLTAFIICLLALKVNTIQAIGIPFYALIDPSNTYQEKCMVLLAVLSVLLVMTKAQSTLIKGEGLECIYIPYIFQYVFIRPSIVLFFYFR